MESQRLRDCLAADFRRLRDVAGGADLGAAVPSCPGWTMTDLLRHVGQVYLHKVECMRLGREPDPWPPAGLADEPVLDLLDRSHAALAGEFAARPPHQHAFTWYDPDQTVGFWIRRMAQETVIHRIDAELAAGAPVAAVPDDLAADGIDELLAIFVVFATTMWPEDFAEILPQIGEDRAVGLVTPHRSWLLRLTSKEARLDGPDAAGADAAGANATVEGSAPDLLRWLWGRGQAGVTTTGAQETIALLRKVLTESTQ